MIKLPVIVGIDNEGAIFTVSNIMTMSHTKHVDTIYMYVNEYVESDIVKIVLKSAKNDIDIFKKKQKWRMLWKTLKEDER